MFLTRCCFVLTTLILLNACQKKPQVQRPQPLPQDPAIQVYFNHNQAQGADYTEPYRQTQRAGDDLEDVIVEAVASAQATVDVAVQEFNLPRIAQVLAERHRAGVQVRVILENNYSRPWSELSSSEVGQLDSRNRGRYSEFLALVDSNQDGQLSAQEIAQGDALVMLRNVGIPVIDDTADGSKGSGLMHHKFAIIDGATVLTGSNNWTISGTHGDFSAPDSRGNANNLLKIDSSRLASLFQEEFNVMWGDGPGGQTDSKFGVKKPLRALRTIPVGTSSVTVQFSPSSASQPWTATSNGLIGQTLQNATNSIRLALFVFSEQKLADILETEHQQGVDIKALIDPGFAFRSYSEGLDLLGVALSNKCQYEKANRPWQNAIATVGVPQLPQGDKLHHKYGVVDEHIVITGSHNWSAAANNTNDETVLVIQSPTVAAHFVREFERLYSQAVLGVPVWVQKKMEAEQQQCP
ncbi:MAG: phospholipase D-like domain-containing protein [Cyanophyceae cyanobacterium]